jgi:hypothetical protein
MLAGAAAVQKKDPLAKPLKKPAAKPKKKWYAVEEG